MRRRRLAVEELQHLVDLAEFVVKQRQMPPVVHLEEAVACPGLGIVAHPGDAVALPALHLHDMGDRMLRPAVARLDADRLAAEPLRRAHSRPFPPARRRAWKASRDSRPCRATMPACARAMRSRSIRELPVKKSIWWPTSSASASRGSSMVTSSSIRPASCQRPSARWPRAATWPRSRAGRRQPDGRLVAGFHDVHGLAVGGEAEEIALQHMRHDEVGRFGKCRVDRGDRIADIALQFVQRLLVVADGGRIGAGKLQAQLIRAWHGASPLSCPSAPPPWRCRRRPAACRRCG